MTYEGMKPMTEAANQSIADWVKAGGALVFVDDDRDPYHAVKSWWNRPGASSYRIPREALFATMGIPRGAKPGLFTVGKGTVIFDAASPAGLTYRREGAGHVRDLVRRACSAAKLDYRETSHLALRRGPYVIAAGLGDSPSGEGHELRGRFVDLLAQGLPIVTSVKLTPGRRVLLVDVDSVKASFPRVLASACKVMGGAQTPGGGIRFLARGPDQTEAAIRVGLPRPPRTITVDQQPAAPDSRTWDEPSRTLLVRFPNKAQGRQVAIE
jgi:hypothetical protein